MVVLFLDGRTFEGTAGFLHVSSHAFHGVAGGEDEGGEGRDEECDWFHNLMVPGCWAAAEARLATPRESATF